MGWWGCDTLAGLREVARAASVSLGTASAVYTGSRGVSSAARRRVLAAAAALRYEARPRARSSAGSLVLMSHYGSLDSLLAHPNDGDIAQSILEGAGRARIPVSYVQITAANAGELLVRERSRTRRAFILLNVAPNWSRDALRRRRSGQIPVIVGDRGLAHRYDTVVSDDISSMRSMADRMAAAGERRFVILQGPQEYTAFRDRFTAATDTLSRAGGPHHLIRCVRCADGFPAGRVAAASVLATAGGRHATVLAAHDLQALGLLSGLQQMGVSVPEDLSLIGWDDIVPARNSTPELTTVRVPRRLLGRLAEQLAEERLAGTGSGPPQTVTVSCDFIERQTTRSAAPDGRKAVRRPL